MNAGLFGVGGSMERCVIHVCMIGEKKDGNPVRRIGRPLLELFKKRTAILAQERFLVKTESKDWRADMRKCKRTCGERSLWLGKHEWECVARWRSEPAPRRDLSTCLSLLQWPPSCSTLRLAISLTSHPGSGLL